MDRQHDVITGQPLPTLEDAKRAYRVTVKHCLNRDNMVYGRNFMETIATGLTQRQAYAAARQALTDWGIIEARAYSDEGWADLPGRQFRREMTDAEREAWRALSREVRDGVDVRA